MSTKEIQLEEKNLIEENIKTTLLYSRFSYSSRIE